MNTADTLIVLAVIVICLTLLVREWQRLRAEDDD